MGYAGATLWGWGIYTLAGAHKRVAQYFTYFILLVLACSVIFWVRDLLTLIIVAILISMFVFLVKMKTLHYLQIVLQFMGVIILLNSLFSPMYLLDGRNLGDGAALAASTFIPELVWIVIWCALALFACVNLAKSPRKR